MYIPYAFLFLLGLTVILTLFFPGLVNVDTEVDVTNQEDYRKAIVLENLLSLKGDTSQYGYQYTYRKGMLPVEYFANLNPENDELGYEVRGTQSVGHCYIPEVSGLDGTNFAFGIEILAQEHLDEEGNVIGNGEPNEDFKSVELRNHDGNNIARRCTGMDPQERRNAVVAPALLVRENKSNPVLPVRLYVYDPTPYA